MRLADWIDQQQRRLDAQPILGYMPGERPAAEPVAIAALTACSYRWKVSARAAVGCLVSAQNRNGSVSVGLNDQGPFWTTSLACIAWRQFEKCWSSDAGPEYRDAYRKGIDYLTQCGGETIERPNHFGHDTSLVGWPWVLGTHSWLEPTCLALMAMRHCGFSQHPRAIEAAGLLVDRQLPLGGANFGNTTVLGKQTRAHVLPSAMSVVAFHQVRPIPQPISKTIEYLRDQLNRPLGSVSLAWLIHALVSGAWDSTGDLASEFQQPIKSAISLMAITGSSPHRQNLLLLAARTRESVLLDMPPVPWKGIRERLADE